MAASALKLLRDTIRLKQFDGAYFIYGEDEFQKNDAVEQLIEAAVDPATKDFNLSLVNGGDMTAESIESLASTPPMMADRRVVVIRNVGALKKDARKRLDAVLKQPAYDTTLILVAGAGDKADKALEKSTTPLEFAPLSQDRLPRWIAYTVKHHHNMEITPEATDLLLTAAGTDLYVLGGELDKLASFSRDGIITEDDVASIVGIRRGETVGDLFDLVLQKDASRAVELLPHILLQPKNSAVTLIMGLSVQMLAVGWGRARVDDGFPPSRLEGEFFQLLKRTGAFPMRPWGQAAKAWARAVQDWSSKGCEGAIDALVLADGMIKDSRVSSEEQVLATTILAVCAADQVGRRRKTGDRRSRHAA